METEFARKYDEVSDDKYILSASVVVVVVFLLRGCSLFCHLSETVLTLGQFLLVNTSRMGTH